MQEDWHSLIEMLSSICYTKSNNDNIIPQQHVSLNQYVSQCVVHKNVKPDVTHCGKSLAYHMLQLQKLVLCG